MTSTSPMFDSRREFLGWTAAAVSTVALAPFTTNAAETDPYGGFKMGLQSYSLRAFDAKTALAHTQKLGVKYWESFRNHIALDTAPEKLDAVKSMLKEAGVTLLAFGVEGFNENEGAARKAFDFAKAMHSSPFWAGSRTSDSGILIANSVTRTASRFSLHHCTESAAEVTS